MRALDKDDLPKWQKVKYDIELKILSGEYPAGEKVPSVRKLAELYNIGTSSSQKVLERLCQEGTIVMEVGIGYSVNGKCINQLRKEHKERLWKILEQACEYALTIGVDPVEIIKSYYDKNDK